MAPPNSAASGIEPPPLGNWTQESLQRLRIQRLFPVCESLGASSALLGAAMLRALLGDLLMRNSPIPLGPLQGQDPPWLLKGPIELKALVQDLATKDAFWPPATFGRARDIVRQSGRDVVEVLQSGFEELKIHSFPAVTYRDVRKKRVINWDGKSWWQVLRPGDTPSAASRAAASTLAVCVEVERRGLSWSRNLQVYRDHGMPWMEKVLVRLPRMAAGQELLLLTFLSCIGMLQNGDYVSYNDLAVLVTQLPVPQSRLQALHLMSNFSLPRMSGVVLYKLHEDIPHRLQKEKPKLLSPTKRKEPAKDEDTLEVAMEGVQEVRVDLTQPCPPTLKVRCLPASSKVPWTTVEEGMIPLDGKTHKQAYAAYCESASKAGIAVRTFFAFRSHPP